MADLTVAVEIEGQDNGATNVVNSVSSAFGGLANAAKAPTSAIGGIFDTVGKLGIGVLGIKNLAEGLGGLAAGFVAGNSQMEVYETQLGTLMGSADKAKDRLAELAEFGAKTPFELPEVVRAEKVLLGFGLTGEKVFKLTGQTGEQFRSTVGDIAAGTGASFEEIALNMGKFASGATGEAISRFQEMGIATREQLSEMGVQFSKSGELLSPLPVAMQAITQLAQQKFGGGMEKLSQTFSGQISTMQDNFSSIQRTLAQPIFDVLKDAIAAANNAIGGQGFQQTLQNLAQLLAGGLRMGLQLGAQAFDIMVGGATALAPVVQMVFERLTTFIGGLAQGATIAKTVNSAFGDLIPVGLNPILDAVDTAFKNVKTSVSDLVSTFRAGGLPAVWNQINAAMSDFAPTGQRIGTVLSTVRDAVLALVPQPVQNFVSGLLSMKENAADGVSPMRLLATVVNTVSETIEEATKFIKDNIAVQAALIAVLTAAGTAWAISSAVKVYNQALEIGQAAVKAYAAVQAVLNAVLTANPIGIVIVALAGLTAALIFAYNNSETFRKIVDDTFAVLKQGVTNAITSANQMLTLFRTALNTTSGIIERLSDTVQDVFSNIRSTISSILSSISDTMSNIWNTIERTIGNAFDNIQNTIESALGNISFAITTAWNAINNTIDSTLNIIGRTISTGWDNVRNVVDRAISTIHDEIMGMWNALPEDIRNDLSTIYNNISQRFEDMRQSVEDKMSDISTAVQAGWQAASDAADTVFSTILTATSTAWENVRTTVSTAFGGISSAVSSGWSAANAAARPVLNAINTTVDTAWETIKTTVTDALTAISGLVTAGWAAVQEATSTAIEAVRVTVETAWNLISTTITTVMTTIQTAVIAAWEAVRAAIEEKVNAVLAIVQAWIKNFTGLLEGLKTTIYGLANAVGQSIIDGIRAGISAGWAALEDFIGSLARGLLQKAKDALGAKSPSREFRNLGLDIVRGLHNGIQDASEIAYLAIDDTMHGIIDRAGRNTGGYTTIGGAIVTFIGKGIKDNTDEMIRAIRDSANSAEGELGNLDRWLQDWIGRVVEHRTELLKRFNYAAFLRGEGTKVLPELKAVTDEYERGVRTAFTRAAEALVKIAQNYHDEVAKARADAQLQAEAAIAQAAQQAANLIAQRALQKQLQEQRDAFQEMQRVQRDYFDTQQQRLQVQLSTQEQIYRVVYQAQLRLSRTNEEVEASRVEGLENTLDINTELLRIEYERKRDIERAKTVDEAIEVNKRADEARQSLNDRLAEETYLAEQTKQMRLDLLNAQIDEEKQAALRALQDKQNEEIYIETHTAALRAQISDREEAFDRAVREQTDNFNRQMEEAALQRQLNGIYQERDARIAAINTALQEKEAALAASYEKDRAASLANLAQQLEDLRTQYIDKVTQAFHHAQVDIVDFLPAIEELAKQVAGSSGTILDGIQKRIDDIHHSIGDLPQFHGPDPLGTPPGAPNVPPVVIPGNPAIFKPLPNEISRPLLPAPTQQSAAASGGVAPFGITPDQLARLNALRAETGLAPLTAPGANSIVNNYNLTVNGNPSVNTAQEMADTVRRMQLVAG